MTTFQEMGLSDIVLKSLEAMNIVSPTPIQAQTIPLALNNRDILGSAQTGTGKTLAFAIPVVEKLLKNPAQAALVQVPTRELAQQVMTAIKQLLGTQSGIRTALLIGGDSMFKQLQQLRNKPRIIVGTPGRTIDHLKRRTLNPNNLNFLVLDEMDRMFDMGFGIQLEQIISQLPQSRQTLMFSATLSAHVAKLAGKHLNEPERIAIGSVSNPVARIKQEIIRLSESDKYGELLGQIEKREGSIIVFVKTKSGTERLAEKLCKQNHTASAIHGDLRQNKREKVINDFRKGEHRIMVATDVAARGLDIPHIQHVINYDLPQSPEDYIHRIGRTARAGAEGFALCLITPQDGRKWHAINKLMNPDAKNSDRPEPSKSGKFGRSRDGRDRDNKSGQSFKKSNDRMKAANKGKAPQKDGKPKKFRVA